MSERRLENGPKPMSGPEAATGNPSSAHEAARFIATVSLSLGALMLSLSASSSAWSLFRSSPL